MYSIWKMKCFCPVAETSGQKNGRRICKLEMLARPVQLIKTESICGDCDWTQILYIWRAGGNFVIHNGCFNFYRRTHGKNELITEWVFPWVSCWGKQAVLDTVCTFFAKDDCLWARPTDCFLFCFVLFCFSTSNSEFFLFSLPWVWLPSSYNLHCVLCFFNGVYFGTDVAPYQMSFWEVCIWSTSTSSQSSALAKVSACEWVVMLGEKR